MLYLGGKESVKSEDKCVPIKHGGPYENEEAFANKETGEVEDVSWSKGPSDKFYGDTGHIQSRPLTEQGRKNWDRINWHGKKEEK